MNKKSAHTLSSGNVFADLGLANADELQAKADLAIHISRLIERRRLTQTQAAQILGIDQPKVSALMRGRLSGFSMERLSRFLNALGRDVEIIVRPAAAKRAHGILTVSAAAGARRKNPHQGPERKTTTAKAAAKKRSSTRTKK